MSQNTLPLLPTIALGPHRITRLVLGGNPISGNSHISPELDWEMRRYFTAGKILELFRRCEEVGINTFQARGDRHITRLYLEYRQAGGSLQWIAQTASELRDLRANINRIAQFGAIAIYHHGTHLDNLWHAGQIDRARDILNFIRDTGLPAGLGTHIPEVVEYIEEKDWPVDFYMCCLYNLAPRPKRESIVHGADPKETFDPDDPPRMCRVIRQVKKPVLAFKVLAAGRRCAHRRDVEEAFAFAFRNIKPTDAIVVGMFPKYKDQPAENADIVRNILASRKDG